jgi:Ubiquitin carboxyl-terminal hydrolase
MPTIFRWIGVNNGPGSNPGPISGAAHPPVQPSLEPVAFSSPDAKQFGMENVRPHASYFFSSTYGLSLFSLAAIHGTITPMLGLQSAPKLMVFAVGFSYANSVLQALYFCQPFRDLVCMAPDRFQGEAQSHSVSPAPKLSTPDPASEPSLTIPSAPPTLFSALRALYIHISTHPAMKGTISPTSFINKLKKENEIFRSSMHQDAHEFLNYLLNKIVEDLEADLKGAKERAQQDDRTYWHYHG